MVNINLLQAAERVVASDGRERFVHLSPPASIEDRFIVRSLLQVFDSSPIARPAAVQNLKELIATLR